MVRRYCRNATTDDDVAYTMKTIYVTDENGIRYSVSVESKRYGIVAEVVEEAKGHNYKKVTIPADCGHVSMTFYTCTNENCYDNYYMGYTDGFMLDKEGHLISKDIFGMQQHKLPFSANVIMMVKST